MTLVELLIAMAIFTTGILIVIRIFPTGFSILKHTTSATIASRLAQAEIERIEGSNAMPAGILPGTRVVVDGGLKGAFQFVDTDFTKLTDSNSLGTDVNKYRFIFEEPASIPSPTTVSGGMYSFLFGPVAWRSDLTIGDPANNVNRSVVLYSAPMYKLASPTNINDFPNVTTNSSDYLIDYANSKIYVSPSTVDRNFVLTYTDANTLQSYVGVVCYVQGNASTTNQVIDLASMIPGITIRKGSEVLHRRFDQIADGTDMAQWDQNNPYQYRVRHADNAANGLAYAIEFNPHAYGATETTSGGTRALTAYVSYEVLDWHILHEERRIADAPSAYDDPVLNVRLGLGSIKKSGFTIENDNTKYTGLMSSYAPLAYDVVVLDMSPTLGDCKAYYLRYEGDTAVGSLSVPDPLDSDALKQAFTINYKEGIIHFNPYFRGHTVRIYYRSVGDWAVAPYRTCANFAPFYPDSSASSIVLNYSQYYELLKDGHKRLSFPTSYNGRSVILDYTYAVPQLPNGQTYKYYNVYGDVHFIDPTKDCSVDFTNTELTLNRKHSSEMPSGGSVDIMPDYGRTLDDKLTQDSSYLPRVRGASMGVRVIHKDTGEGFKGGLWKLNDLQSSASLTR